VAARGDHGTDRAVDQRGLGVPRRPPEGQHLPCHGVSATDRGLPAGRERGAVGTAYDIGGQYGEQGVEVAVTGGGEERLDDTTPLGELGGGHTGDAAHPMPRPAGQLLRCGRGAVENGRDLVEGHGEQVVQHEGDPLGRAQRVEDHEHRAADRVDEHRLMLGVVRLPWRSSGTPAQTPIPTIAAARSTWSPPGTHAAPASTGSRSPRTAHT
jgi:hypothetical protein